MAHKITLHHLNASRSDRIAWALEELGVPYDIKAYLRLPTGTAPPDLKKVSPFGKSPVLELDGEVITESAYILYRLLALFPDTQTIETKPSNDTVFWSHFSEASQMNVLQASAILSYAGAAWSQGLVGGLNDEEKKGVAKFSSGVNEQFLGKEHQTNLDQIEKFLAKGNEFFSGGDKPGMGDFMMFYALDSIISGQRQMTGLKVGPETKKWYETVMARPALKKALARLQEEEAKAKAKL